jgi:hypothetical protein
MAMRYESTIANAVPKIEKKFARTDVNIILNIPRKSTRAHVEEDSKKLWLAGFSNDLA